MRLLFFRREGGPFTQLLLLGWEWAAHVAPALQTGAGGGDSRVPDLRAPPARLNSRRCGRTHGAGGRLWWQNSGWLIAWLPAPVFRQQQFSSGHPPIRVPPDLGVPLGVANRAGWRLSDGRVARGKLLLAENWCGQPARTTVALTIAEIGKLGFVVLLSNALNFKKAMSIGAEAYHTPKKVFITRETENAFTADLVVEHCPAQIKTLSSRRQRRCELSFCAMTVLRHRRGLWDSELTSRHGPSKAGELVACLLQHQRTGTQLPCDQKRKRGSWVPVHSDTRPFGSLRSARGFQKAWCTSRQAASSPAIENESISGRDSGDPDSYELKLDCQERDKHTETQRNCGRQRYRGAYAQRGRTTEYTAVLSQAGGKQKLLTALNSSSGRDSGDQDSFREKLDSLAAGGTRGRLSLRGIQDPGWLLPGQLQLQGTMGRQLFPGCICWHLGPQGRHVAAEGLGGRLRACRHHAACIPGTGQVSSGPRPL
ncbi:hypothetical protein QTO34_018558 [Cnephaeus nilssonii]|uniref:Uncharacterized protein n=1 Tax=Cnephaeus nilssonii TaxID=3371016 RepID=A0AA40HZ17_CNENI|nr:hypothetical protein QTO34_018558 [Eptesicus nilssonii]